MSTLALKGLKPATFDLNGKVYYGYHIPNSNWNGFEQPFFEAKEALKVLTETAAEDKTLEFTFEGKTFFYKEDGGSIDMIEPLTVEMGGVTKIVYPLSLDWCWMLETPND